ncbi:hypothetical protein HGM15179_005276 [Zosterops borbonicus]|uniref:Uncharacterized protein n=1 Tax=Zosterops borbonicus TaxID=364589 RepID=A0A8K1LQ90_9PASS|nr:hypothetical protein HGM15179_005276 [Zosterops borbonicus]
MKFNKAKCKVLCVGQSSPEHKYGLGREYIKGSPKEKDLGIVIKGAFSKVADKIKLCGTFDGLEGRDSIQRDCDMLGICACANLMKFNKAKCKVLCVGQSSPEHKYGLGREYIKGSPKEKDLGMLIDKQLNMTQKCVLAAQKANCVLGCTKRNVASRLREVILPLYSTHGIPCLEYCIQVWDP